MNHFVVIVQIYVTENNKQNLTLENLNLNVENVEYECTDKFNINGTNGNMTMFHSTLFCAFQNARMQCSHTQTPGTH